MSNGGYEKPISERPELGVGRGGVSVWFFRKERTAVAVLPAEFSIVTVEPARAAGDVRHPVLNVAQGGLIPGLVFVDVHARLLRTEGESNKVVVPKAAGAARRFRRGEVGHRNRVVARGAARLHQRARELIERVEGLFIADAMHDQQGGVLRHPPAGKAALMKFAQDLVWVGLKPSALVLWSVGRVQSVE